MSLRSKARAWFVAAKAGRPRFPVDEETRVRAVSMVLWVLVILGALGGVTSWTRGRPSIAPTTADPVADTSAGWEAAGFAARFVEVYLSAGEDGLGPFLGAEVAVPGQAGVEGEPPQVQLEEASVAGLQPAGPGYWAVTVFTRGTGGERYWRVGVAERADGLVVAALPTPVAAPTPGEAVELAPEPVEVPVSGDPMASTVAGFAAAYACGEGDLDRYVVPGATIDPIRPPICQAVRMDRWGVLPQADGRQVVLSEVLLDPGPEARRVALPLVLSRRGDRWEVAQLLAAPVIAGASIDTTGLTQ